jgi:hypothetical protein
MKLLLTLVAIALFSAPVLAGPPIPGVYFSYDMPGGTFNAGRFSESFAGAGTYNQVGNTVNAASWNGSVLGTDWKIWCSSISVPPTLISDTRDGFGTGDVTWQASYGGGHFWLASTGPWGNGQDYTGDFDVFNVTSTFKYVFGTLLGIRWNMTTSGQIDGYTECFFFSINNCAFFSDTDSGPMPAGFPPFMDSSCNTGTLTRGGWGSVTQLAFQLTECQVPIQPSTWGQIKSLYGE